jgi:undecaprenyl diphosphate synthase
MLNYGSRKEITTACLNIANDYQKGVLTNITEETISQYLYTKNNPEIDILIRTGGDIRISNYMLWQIAYSELFFLPILWPDFNQKVLIEVIQQFQTRDRRFGGLTKA